MIDKVLALFQDNETLHEVNFNLKNDLSIDLYALDIEANRQAEIVGKWLVLLTQAQGELSKAKEVLATTIAELQLEARSGGYDGPGKMTEAAIDAWVKKHDRYLDALRKRDNAEEAVGYLNSAKIALEHKKLMIQTESNLWMCGYFCRPHVPDDVKNASEDERRVAHVNKLKDSLGKRKYRERREAEQEN